MMHTTRRAMLIACAAASAAVTLLLHSACTLILPTDTLIVPCTSDNDCDEGFECRENACLPIDVNDSQENDDNGTDEGGTNDDAEDNGAISG